jgi:hypothetical protein
VRLWEYFAAGAVGVIGFLLGRLTADVSARRRERLLEERSARLRERCESMAQRLLELVETVQREQVKRGKRDGRASTN